MPVSAGKMETWFLPYCLRRQPDGRYALLNRRMVPVGLFVPLVAGRPEPPFADVHLLWLPGLTPSIAKVISVDGSDNTEAVMLYKSIDAVLRTEEAFQSYTARLYILMQLRVER